MKPRLVALLTVIAHLSAACGGARAPEPDLADMPLIAEMGRFGFVATVAGGQRLTGTLDVAPDTLVARAAELECRVAPQQPNGEVLTYDCVVPGTSGVSLLIDRRNPTRKSTWSMVSQVTKKRDICVAWRTWENGSRTCTRSEPEEYFERVRVNGPLVVTR